MRVGDPRRPRTVFAYGRWLLMDEDAKHIIRTGRSPGPSGPSSRPFPGHRSHATVPSASRVGCNRPFGLAGCQSSGGIWPFPKSTPFSSAPARPNQDPPEAVGDCRQVVGHNFAGIRLGHFVVIPGLPRTATSFNSPRATRCGLVIGHERAGRRLRFGPRIGHDQRPLWTRPLQLQRAVRLVGQDRRGVARRFGWGLLVSQHRSGVWPIGCGGWLVLSLRARDYLTGGSTNRLTVAPHQVVTAAPLRSRRAIGTTPGLGPRPTARGLVPAPIRVGPAVTRVGPADTRVGPAVTRGDQRFDAGASPPPAGSDRYGTGRSPGPKHRHRVTLRRGLSRTATIAVHPIRPPRRMAPGQAPRGRGAPPRIRIRPARASRAIPAPVLPGTTARRPPRLGHPAAPRPAAAHCPTTPPRPRAEPAGLARLPGTLNCPLAATILPPTASVLPRETPTRATPDTVPLCSPVSLAWEFHDAVGGLHDAAGGQRG